MKLLRIIRRSFQVRERHGYLFRKALLWLGLVSALAIEGWLIAFDVPEHLHAHAFWPHVAVALAVLLLPLTLASIAARLPFGRKYIKRRYMIEPIRLAKVNSIYNGAAISSLVFYGLVQWPSQSSGRVDKETFSISPEAKISLPYVSLPLAWIWAQFRSLVTGSRDVTIQGVLVDTDDPIKLKLWTIDSRYIWEAELEPAQFGAALESAIRLLTKEILKALDPVVLARIYSQQWNYDEAIRLLMAEEPSPSRDIQLAQLYLDSDFDELALSVLNEVREKRLIVSAERHIAVHQSMSQALTKIGDYEGAHEVLTDLTENLERPMRRRHRRKHLHEIQNLLASCHACARSYDAAIQMYDQAEVGTWNEIRRLTGSVRGATVDNLLERCRFSKSTSELTDLLWAMHNICTGRARCRTLNKDEPLRDYLNSRVIVSVLRDISFVPRREIEAADAVVCKALGQYFRRADDLAEGLKFNALGCDLYDVDIRLSRDEVKKQPDDLSAVTGLAWAYCGKVACLHRLLADEQPSDAPPHLGAAVELLSDLMDGLSSENLTAINSARRRAMRLDRRANARDCTADSKYSDAIAKAAGALLVAVWKDAGQERLDDWLDRLSKLTELRDAMIYAGEEVGVSGEFIQTSLRAIDLPGVTTTIVEEVQPIFESVLRILNLSVHAVSEETREDLMRRVTWRKEKDTALEDCQIHFEWLLRHKHRHHQAEGWYGLACLSSILSDAEEAVYLLKQSIDHGKRTETQSGFVNRARLDEDFDEIRDNDKFQELVGSAPIAIP